MSQLLLFQSVPHPVKSEDQPKTARPEGETGPVAVLRDWHEQLEHYDLVTVPAAQLYRDPRSRSAPRGLLDQVFEAVLDSLKPVPLLHKLRQAHPRARLRRLSIDDIEAGVLLHREALRLAQQFGLDLARVATIIQPLLREGEEGKGDTVELRDLDGVRTERRTVVSHVRPPDARIGLPPRWWKTHRPEEAPWNPPPEGWEMSGRRWWLKKRLVLRGASPVRG